MTNLSRIGMGCAVSALVFANAARAQETTPPVAVPPTAATTPSQQQAVQADATPEAAVPSATTPETTTPETTTPGDIIVTGSRIQMTGFAAPTPTTILGREEIDQRAPASVDDIVTRLPSVRLTAGNSQSQRLYTSGVAPVDLRGLGPVRTLTLVDGERFTPTTDDGTVDSNIIPVGLIDRIDVVTGGASAAYGSDAVAGVVNFVLNKKLVGLRASAQAGVSEYGDAAQQAFTLAGGANFAGGHGHILIGGDYAHSDGAGTIYSRPWGRKQPYLVANGATRGADVPAQSFATDVTYSQQSTGGLILSGPLAGTAFGTGGAPYPFQFGTVLSSLMIGGDNPAGNPNGNFALLLPNQRRTALVRVDYEFSDALSFYAEGNYGYSESAGQTGFYQGKAVIGIDNAFLPDQVRSEMLDDGLTSITVGKLFADNGGTQLFKSHRTLRGIAGLSGKLFGDFTWDGHVQYGETHNYLNVKDVLVANFLAAADAVRGPDGTIECAPLAANPNLTAARIGQVEPGCVPLNIFGTGSSSQAAQDYVTGNGGAHEWTNVSRLAADVNLRGSPFSTWAGDAQLALGAEYRKDTVDANADAASLAGAYNAANYGRYSGSVKVGEGYGEIGIPLAKNVSFAKSLDLNAAVRVTDYSTSGWVATWKAGATWEPIEGLRFRGTRSRDIRAPSLYDLYYVKGSGGLANITNPFNGVSGHLIASATGNPDLVPERADTMTIGAVIEPRWTWSRGFRFSLDYYDIKINKAISTVAAADVIQRCFQGQQIYCSGITFDGSAFGIANVNTEPYNVASVRNRGLEGALSYNTRLGDIGALNFRALVTRTLELSTNDQNSKVDRAGALQSGGVPKWTGTTDLSFSSGGFLTTFSSRFFSGSKYDATLFDPSDPGYDATSGNSINDNHFPGAAYFDLYAEYGVKSGASRFTFFGKIENLANKAPALYAATAITSGGDPYDLIGRRFTFGVRFSR